LDIEKELKPKNRKNSSNAKILNTESKKPKKPENGKKSKN